MNHKNLWGASRVPQRRGLSLEASRGRLAGGSGRRIRRHLASMRVSGLKITRDSPSVIRPPADARRRWGGTRSGEQQSRSRVRAPRRPSAFPACRAALRRGHFLNPAPGGIVPTRTGDAVAAAAAAGTGVAAAQLCGTDIVPTKVARPTPADTADPPKPDDPSAADRRTDLAQSHCAHRRRCSSPREQRRIHAAETGSDRPPPRTRYHRTRLSPPDLCWPGSPSYPRGTRSPVRRFRRPPTADPLCPLRRFRNPAIPVVAVFDPGANGLTPPEADDSGDASSCSALGTVDITCDSVDCTPVPVDVPVAWAAAPAWLAARPGWWSAAAS